MRRPHSRLDRVLHSRRAIQVIAVSASRHDRTTSTVMEEGGTELEAEAEEGELEGPVWCICEDMEEGDTELEEGELAGQAEEGVTELEAEAEEGELAGAAELEATLSHSLPPFS